MMSLRSRTKITRSAAPGKSMLVRQRMMICRLNDIALARCRAAFTMWRPPRPASRKYRGVEDGSFVIDATTPVGDVLARLRLKEPQEQRFVTVSGLVFDNRARVSYDGWDFEISRG